METFLKLQVQAKGAQEIADQGPVKLPKLPSNKIYSADSDQGSSKFYSDPNDPMSYLEIEKK